MATVTDVTLIEAKLREDAQRGKNEARRLRAQGRIPAVLYGAKKDALAVSLDPKQIARVLTSETGHNTIFDLQVGAEKTKAMIVDWQYEPIKGWLMHIDLKRIAMDERLRVKVPIMLKGEPAGVKQQGGILEQVLREVELECLPGDIPSHIDVDVSELVFGQVVRVSDLPHGGKVKFLTDEPRPKLPLPRPSRKSSRRASRKPKRARPKPRRSRERRPRRSRKRPRRKKKKRSDAVIAGRLSPARVILSAKREGSL